MFDEVKQYKVFLKHWKELLKEIENEVFKTQGIYEEILTTQYQGKARLILEECFGSGANKYLQEINKAKKLRPKEKIMELIPRTLQGRMRTMQYQIEILHEHASKRQVIRGQLGRDASLIKAIPVPVKKADSPPSNKVFIVHGHDEAMKQYVARTLDQLGLDPVILHEQPNRGRTIIEKFEEEAADVGFAVVLLSPDDEGRKTGDEDFYPRSRQNVVLELGFFFGKLGRGRVVALYNEVKEYELPSDISGVLFIPYDRRGAWRMTLCSELKESGYGVSADDLK